MKEKILEEAERLFWKYGVRSITMDDIARRLAISKKTIYQHFSDKEDILTQVTQYRMAKDHEMMCCATTEAQTPIHEVMAMLDMLRQNADNVNPALVMDIKRYYPKAWAIYGEFKENFIMKSIIDNIRRGINDGYFRADVNPEILARMRVEQIEMVFEMLAFPQSYDMITVQQELTHHFVRGLLTEKGFSIYNQYNSTIQHEIPT
ncbi:MAG: TetR/AcrR family transcriptional regulator [Cytophagales bacterium]|nr:MAG: TetR/AcrR family transcriptional regulator [Cytophagales bacterium]